MNPPNVKVVTAEELIELLTKRPETEQPSLEEVFELFSRACRLAYTVTRNTLDHEKPLIGNLIELSAQRMTGDGTNGACAALLMEATSQYLDMKLIEDRELFKKEFILGVDRAIEIANKYIEEAHDTRTKQSTQERSAESPTTP